MKITCNATSSGYSIVLPPSPGSALGYQSSSSPSIILSPLQPSVHANSNINNFKPTSKESPPSLSPSSSSSSPHMQKTPSSPALPKITHTDKDTTEYNNNYYNKENYDNFSDTNPTNVNHNTESNGNKRKYESPDLTAHSKQKRTVLVHDDITDPQISMYTSPSFPPSVFSKDDSISNILLDDKLLDSKIKLLQYANSFLDKQHTILEDRGLAITHEDPMLNIIKDQNNDVNSDSSNPNGHTFNNTQNEALAKALEEHKNRVITRFRKLADGAGFRMSDDLDELEDFVDESLECDEDEEGEYGHNLSSMANCDSEGAMCILRPLGIAAVTSEIEAESPRDFIYSASVSAQWEKEAVSAKEKEEEFNPYTFIRNLPSRASPSLESSAILLPPLLPSEPRYTLVLDLDETLVHCSTESLAQPDLVFPVLFNAVEYTVFARKRPHIQEFLSRVASLFEVVVFTASQEVYADKLLDILDPEKKYIKHRLFRDSCLCVEGNYLKDLTVLGRDLSKVIIVDNSPQAFGYHVDNGIPIESWFDDDNDTELLSVSTFLESLLSSDDVRPLIREKYKLHELISRA